MPRNPIEYFATWLQEYSNVQKKARKQADDEKLVQEFKEKHEDQLRREEAQQKQREIEAEKKMQENEQFWVELEKSDDPFDNLEGLAQYIHDNIGSTGVYIGQLEPPFLPIKEDADKAAHLDLNNP